MEESLISVTGKPLKPHEYILLKECMDAGDDAWIKNHSAKMRGKGRDTEVVMTMGEVQLATVQRMVRGWNLSRTVTNPITSEKIEQPIPFSVEAIAKLPVPIYRFLLKKIDELNPDDEEEDEETFLPAVVDSSEDTFQAERVLRMKH